MAHGFKVQPSSDDVARCHGCRAWHDPQEGETLELVDVTVRATATRLVLCPACLTELSQAIHPYQS